MRKTVNKTSLRCNEHLSEACEYSKGPCFAQALSRTLVKDTVHPSSDVFIFLLQLDFDVYASGQIELHQRIHRFIRRVNDVHQALVSSNFELIAAGLVHVR